MQIIESSVQTQTGDRVKEIKRFTDEDPDAHPPAAVYRQEHPNERNNSKRQRHPNNPCG
jgi:hypothetical protein